MGHNIAVPIGLLIWFAGTDALVAKDVTANSRHAYHLHTIVLKMVEALEFTSAATAGLRQDILRFPQAQPYSEARSHAPNSCAATALRLSVERSAGELYFAVGTASCGCDQHTLPPYA